MSYPNGQVPESLLVRRGPTIEGGDALLMPGTAAKFDRLVALGQARHGWTPRISGPDDGYRRLSVQINYKAWYGINAATPGTSSHGGWFEGAESGAVDIGNYEDIGKTAFYALAQDAGFIVNVFDWEPWHIIDRSPWDAPTPSEEDDMPLTDADISKLLNTPAFTPPPGAPVTTISQALKEVHSVFQAVFTGGTSMPDNQRSIGASLDGIVQWLDGPGNAIATAVKATTGSTTDPKAQAR